MLLLIPISAHQGSPLEPLVACAKERYTKSVIKMKAVVHSDHGATDLSRVALLVVLLCSNASRSLAFAPLVFRPSTRPATRRHVFSLNTAFEWLAVERGMDKKYGNFAWFDPSGFSEDDMHSDESVEKMPLYPLGATYLPSMTTHTLNNVEPRNIQMAQDLKVGGRFCVTLVASDSGRLASVGTVMRIIELEPHERDGVVTRIIVRCRAEELVDICAIVNPMAADRERRLLHPQEYLRARVRKRVVEPCTSAECEEAASKIVEDYQSVRFSYLNGDGARDLPPFAHQHLTEALPEWTVEDLATELRFWEAALVWQTLCYTVREGHQMTLSADRNELMVAAASAKGGPLKLPIHVEDLSPADRSRLQDLERQAQSDFLAMGLDPCLDFQVMLAMNSFLERLQFLSQLIARERRRLDERPELVIIEKADELQRNRTGAWFEGFE